MAYVEGRIATVSCNGQDVGGLTEASLSLTTSEISTTVHGTSTFRTFIPGRKEGTISLSCIFDDSSTGQQELIDSWNSGGIGTEVAYVFLIGTTGSYDQYTANGIITSLSFSTPNDDVSQIDAEIRLTGAVTIA